MACAGGHQAIVDYLIGLDGKNVCSDAILPSALLSACGNGNTAIVDMLITHASLKTFSFQNPDDKNTALMLACSKGHTNVLVALVDKMIKLYEDAGVSGGFLCVVQQY
jgi:ankyrin repeat protein